MKLKLLIAFALALAASAADPADWTAVTRIPSGTSVEVVYGKLQRASGGIITVTTGELSIATRQGERVISRTDVRRISLVNSSRRKHILLCAIGAGLGAAVALIGAHRGDIDVRRDLVTGAGVAAGAAGGVLAGVATARPSTIYRAP